MSKDTQPANIQSPYAAPDTNEGNQRNDIERQEQKETKRPVDKFNGPLTGDDITDKQNRINQLRAMGNDKDADAEEEVLARLKKQR